MYPAFLFGYGVGLASSSLVSPPASSAQDGVTVVREREFDHDWGYRQSVLFSLNACSRHGFLPWVTGVATH